MAKEKPKPQVVKQPDQATVLQGQLRVFQAAGMIKHRHNKRKETKFDRRYSALGPLLTPEFKRIDYVLVQKNKSETDYPDEKKKEEFRKRERMRKRFEDALKIEGFLIKEVLVEDDNEKLVYKVLHCPFKRLCQEAEKVKLEMPLKGCEIPQPKRQFWLTRFIENHLVTDTQEDFISGPFKMNKIQLFQDFENPTYFFRPSLRSFLTHHILINLDIRSVEEKSCRVGASETTPGKEVFQLQVVEDFLLDFCSCCPGLFSKSTDDTEDIVLSKMGLPYLLMKEVYVDHFVLHEDSSLRQTQEEPAADENIIEDDGEKEDEEKKEQWKDQKDPRKILDEKWTVWWKFQPMWDIRNYFGEKIALYFAWAGMMITSLWLPMLFGLGCFIYGLTISVKRSSENLQMPGNLTAREEIKWKVGRLYDDLRGAFDNNVTPFFALVICLWGTVFLELWKRHNARLAYEWDVDQYEQNQPDRPQFFGTKVKKDPVTQDDNWFYPFRRQMLKFCLSASAMIFMICIVFISVAGVVVYRVIISVDYCSDMLPWECIVTTNVVSALLNAISILLLGRVYDLVAFELTEWENHRTQTAYDDALIIKLFAFQFANSYASCFYIAFFRGRFDAFGVFGLGEEYSDACEGGNCMSQLSFQVFILMLAKPFPKFFKDILLPFLLRLWRRRPQFCRSNCCKNQVDEKKSKKKAYIPHIKYLRNEHKKPNLGDFTLGEYTEKIIMYGFLMLFAASFPLAPFIALVWLFIDKQIDVKRLLWFNRRPVAFIAQDIGMWYSILNFVNLVGVVSNGFLIAFTSTWGVKYDIVTRLWICIGFEHIVFALKFILAYMIPDVPKDVRLSMRREKYQVALKMEDKEKKVDYTELVPETTYDFKAIENSKNYMEFPEEGELKGRHSNNIAEGAARAISTVMEEEEEMEKAEQQGSKARVGPVTKQANSFDDSHGTVSLRGVDPQGSRLLDNKNLSPVEDVPDPLSKTKAPHSPPRKPPLSAGSKKSKGLTTDITEQTVLEENESSIASNPNGWSPDPVTIDPYSVVRQVDMRKSLGDDSHA